MHLDLESGHLRKVPGKSISGPTRSLAGHEQPCLLLFCGGSQERHDIEKKAEHLVSLEPPCSVGLVAGILWYNLSHQSRPSFLKEGNDFEVRVAQANDATGVAAATNRRRPLTLKHSRSPRKIAHGPALSLLDSVLDLLNLGGRERSSVRAHAPLGAALTHDRVFVRHNKKYTTFLAHIVNPAGLTIYQAIKNASDGSHLLPPLQKDES
jgi:hypothetical protein